MQDTTQLADTVQPGIMYEIGYTIGAYLPFLILGTVMLIMYLHHRKHAKDRP